MSHRRVVAGAVLAAAATMTLAVPAISAPSRADAARLGTDWLATRQRSDGSFAQAGRADLTAEVTAAIVTGGRSGKVVSRAINYVSANGRGDATTPGFTGRIVAGIVAAGHDPASLGGTDYLEMLESSYDASSGAYDDEQLFPNLLAANGILAAKGDLPSKAVDRITSNACPNGGFGYDYGCKRGPDVDTTAWAINVLVAAGEKSHPVIAPARDYMLTMQRADGGFAFTKALPTSSDSTGLALTAIAALGENARKAPWRQSDSDDPVSALIGLQDASGGFKSTRDGKVNVMSTTNAVPGLAAATFPIARGEGVGPEPSAGGGDAEPNDDESDSKDESDDTPSSDADDDQKTDKGETSAEAEVAASAPPGGSSGSDGSEATATPYVAPRFDDAGDAAVDGESFSAPSEADDGGGIGLALPLSIGVGVLGSAGTGFGVWLARRRGLL